MNKGEKFAVSSNLVGVFDNFDEDFMMESTSSKSVTVRCVDEPLRNGDSRTKFLFHVVRHLCQMDFVDS